MKVSLEGLENFKNKHHELLNHVMRLLLNGEGSTTSVDKKQLETIWYDKFV